MNISFEGKTNKNYVKINTLKIKLKTGSVITIDRKETEWSYDEETGDLNMVWKDCYLHAIDDFNIFEDKNANHEGLFINDTDNVREFVNLIGDGKSEFEIEDDADEDYWVKFDMLHIS